MYISPYISSYVYRGIMAIICTLALGLQVHTVSAQSAEADLANVINKGQQQSAHAQPYQSPSTTTTLANGLYSYFPMDDKNDAFGFATTGESGSISYPSGFIDNALRVATDAQNSMIYFGNSIGDRETFYRDVIYNDATVNAWVNISSFDSLTDGYMSIIDGSPSEHPNFGGCSGDINQWRLSVIDVPGCTYGQCPGTSGTERFRLAVPSYSATGAYETENRVFLESTAGNLSPNRWYMVTATHDSTTHTWKLYVNGALENSVTKTAGIGPGALTEACPYAIGDRPLSSPYGYPFSGMIDEVGFWDRTLSESEVLALYNDGAGLSLEELLATPYTCSSTSLLCDTFDAPPLDTNKWSFQTNGANSSYAIDQGNAIINGGTIDGGGAWLLSNVTVTANTEPLILETRIKVNIADGGFWGLIGATHDGTVGMSVSLQGELNANIFASGSGSGESIPIGGVDVTEWHTYRIELTETVAKFFVDDELKLTNSQYIPIGKPLHLRLDRVSRGQNELLFVDHVELYREINTSSAIFFEDFADGEIDNNPTWNASNNAWAVTDEQLHVDGLHTDGSGRYRTGFFSQVNLQADDYLDISFQGKLKSTGNPQEGRAINFAVFETGAGNGYHLRIQNKQTSGFPVNQRSFALSITGDRFEDLVTSDFIPGYDEFYTIRAVRQNGLWTLYVDAQIIGTATDPLALTAFQQVKFDIVGSSLVDNVIVKTAMDPPANPPIADAGGDPQTGYSGTEGTSLTFDGASSSDPDGDLLQYRWDFNGDGTWDTAFSDSPTAEHTFPDNFVGTIHLEVTDGEQTDTDTAPVAIANIAPTVSAPMISPEPSDEGSPAIASATFSDPGINDAPFTCTVNYGDGTGDLAGTVTGNTCVGPSHIYRDNGTYQVAATVIDKDGATSNSGGPPTIVEEFDSVAGFSQTTPEIYIADGQVHWTVYRSPRGYQQYIYREITPFSGDVRLTVKGQVNSWTNNCAVRAGIGHKLTEVGESFNATGISINYGFTGGGCSTQGPLIHAYGAALDYHETYCNFTGNWLWITHNQPYVAEFTLAGGNATLTVPGVGESTGTPIYDGEYSKLFVGYTAHGDWPSCSGTIDWIKIEPLSNTSTAHIVRNVAPTANAGSDQTVYRNEPVPVAGSWTDPAAEYDEPYQWSWDLTGDGVANSSGTAPYGATIEETTSFATEGSYTLTFTVTDKDGGVGSDSVEVKVQNRAPDCSVATPSVEKLWPVNHKFIPIDILNVTDPEGDVVSLTIDSIFQDEAVDAPGSGNTSPDGRGIGSATAEVRAERAGSGNGRVYHIGFTADDGHGGTCSGTVRVGVPQSKKGTPIDEGPLYDSTISVTSSEFDRSDAIAEHNMIYLPLLMAE